MGFHWAAISCRHMSWLWDPPLVHILLQMFAQETLHLLTKWHGMQQTFYWPWNIYLVTNQWSALPQNYIFLNRHTTYSFSFWSALPQNSSVQPCASAFLLWILTMIALCMLLSIVTIGRCLIFLIEALNTSQWLLTNKSLLQCCLNPDLLHCSFGLAFSQL